MIFFEDLDFGRMANSVSAIVRHVEIDLPANLSEAFCPANVAPDKRLELIVALSVL
jgi:hypothetical protein